MIKLKDLEAELKQNKEVADGFDLESAAKALQADYETDNDLTALCTLDEEAFCEYEAE